MKDANAYVDLIIAACKKVSEYIAGLDEKKLLQHSVAQSAVIMQLHIVGELAKKLDKKTREEIEVPWKMIIGLRNIISHEYFLLELGAIWNIASRNIPELEEKLHQYLKARGTAYMPPFSDETPLME